MRVTHWPPNQIEQRWGDLAPLFQLAVDESHEELNLLDVYNLALTGFYHVAIADDGEAPVAVICYRVAIKPRLRILLMELAGGTRLEEWMEPNEQYAFKLLRGLQCDRLELVGRPGWARALRRKYPDRVREKSVTLILEADDGRRT